MNSGISPYESGDVGSPDHRSESTAVCSRRREEKEEVIGRNRQESVGVGFQRLVCKCSAFIRRDTPAGHC